MFDAAPLKPEERAFLEALDSLQIRYLLGEPRSDELSLWFGSHAPWDTVRAAALAAGGFCIWGFGRARLVGPGLERFRLAQPGPGSRSFEEEYEDSEECEVMGLRVRVRRERAGGHPDPRGAGEGCKTLDTR
jgi:hypothetical protein